MLQFLHRTLMVNSAFPSISSRVTRIVGWAILFISFRVTLHVLGNSRMRLPLWHWINSDEITTMEQSAIKFCVFFMCVCVGGGGGVYTVYYLWHFGDSWNKVTLNSLHSLSRPFLSIITTLFTCWYKSSDTHTCIRKLGHHWFRLWLAAPSVPSHFLNEYIYIYLLLTVTFGTNAN